MEKNKDWKDYFSGLLLDKEPMTTQYKVAEKLGIQQGTLSKLKSGAMIPSNELAQKISEVWDIDLQELMDVIYKARRESGARYFREAKQREENIIPEIITKPRLPVTAAAGKLSEYLGGVKAHECEYLPVMRSLPDYDFTMFIKGNSMEPKLEDGDEIACKKITSIIEPGKIYVLATRDGVVVKRLYPEENGVRCVSYNVEFPDFFVNKDDFLGIYRVVGLLRV